MIKFRISKRVLTVAIVVGVLLLAAAAGFGAQWLLRNSPTEKAPAVQPENDKAFKEIGDLDRAGKADQADKKIQQLIDDPSTPGNLKFILYKQQGSRFMAKDQPQAALDAYNKAFDINKYYEIAQAMGSAWLKLGDKQKAISFYKKAIELIPADYPMRDDEIRTIQSQIKLIEAGQL